LFLGFNNNYYFILVMDKKPFRCRTKFRKTLGFFACPTTIGSGSLVPLA